MFTKHREIKIIILFRSLVEKDETNRQSLKENTTRRMTDENDYKDEMSVNNSCSGKHRKSSKSKRAEFKKSKSQTTSTSKDDDDDKSYEKSKKSKDRSDERR